MKKIYLKTARIMLITLCLLYFNNTYSQVTITPENVTGEVEITIVYDATQGQSNLQEATKVYMHAGVVTTPNGTTWEHVKGNWGKDDDIGVMTKVSGQNNKWTITITPRTYFNVPTAKKIFRLAMVFRNPDGSKEGKNASGGDIFVNLEAGAYIIIQNPKEKYKFVKKNSSANTEITGTISQQATSITIQVKRSDNDADFTNIHTASNTATYRYTYNLLTATSSATAKSIDITYKIKAVVDGNNLEGIYTQTVVVYDNGFTTTDNTDDWKLGFVVNTSNNGGRFAIQAPQYEFAYVIGSFSGWKLNPEYQLKKSGDVFFRNITFPNLKQGINNIQYQYVLGGNRNIGTNYVQVADPFSTLVIDPNQDQHINETTFPGLPKPEMPSTSIASLIQLRNAAYTWSENERNWQRPPQEDLFIYELLIRDWHKDHSFQSLIDNIDYFKQLGINAIELMPVNEFEGNLSWGYNPSYHNALDKYYGTPNKFKEFIDLCHQNNISVIVDVVYNHVFSQSPLYQMYIDPQDKTKPTSKSPYLNVQAPHPYSVGYDLNHTSQYTQRWVHQTLDHWITEYHLDGFRFDLTKGFTQTESTEQTASRKDESRIANILRYTDRLHSKDDDLYLILEHFADKSEEDRFIAKKLLPWKKMTENYKEIAIGTYSLSKSNVSSANTNDYITYMESHDEQRIAYETQEHGKVDGSYNIKNKKTALYRFQGLATFFCLVPGPKMMWQFQELGYNIDINQNGRTGNKPFAIGTGDNSLYLDGQLDNKNLLEVYKGLLNIRKKHKEAFRRTNSGNNFTWNGDLMPDKVAKLRVSHGEYKLIAIANFDTEAKDITLTFPSTGNWYNVFDETREAEQIATTTKTMNLLPGEYFVYSNMENDQHPIANNMQTLAINDFSIDNTLGQQSYIYPNPNEGVLFINTENIPLDSDSSLVITSINGKVLFSNSIKNKISDANDGILEVKLSEKGFLYKGIAIVTVKTATKSINFNVIFI